MAKRLGREFYQQDVLQVAPGLIGQHLVRIFPDGSKSTYVISETEAYRGGEDLACHASKGKTTRTEVLFGEGGHLYMYLIYGMYWMLNVVTANVDVPQAVLFRGLREISGPGRLTRLIGVDKEYYGEDLVVSDRIWIEESGVHPDYVAGPRVGIDYAGDPWKDMPWRFLIKL
ncbi:MAG: DNA-3-methyladenine glycosylase [Bacteroidetes bacterium]|nr:MAG: DNA-3-methyladenine glycosylase [Bacteroidota bacterium]